MPDNNTQPPNPSAGTTGKLGGYLQQSTYTAIWQAGAPRPFLAHKNFSWLLSAGQLSIKETVPKSSNSSVQTAVFLALQRMLSFLQTTPLNGEHEHCLMPDAYVGDDIHDFTNPFPRSG